MKQTKISDTELHSMTLVQGHGTASGNIGNL